MIGPVLRQELLLGGRRQRLYVFRWIYAGWLLALLLYCWVEVKSKEAERFRLIFLGGNGASNWRLPEISEPEAVGVLFVNLFLYQQLLFLGLVLPALVAGAITDEKRSGTLQYLLTAQLDARHIILGKLLARSAIVGLLALTGLPLFALLAGFSGVEPLALGLVIVILVVLLVALAAAAMLLSVWSRTTVDAVVGMYFLELMLALVVWGCGLTSFNPLSLMEPARVSSASPDVGEVGRRLLVFCAGWLGFGGLCFGLAVSRLRPAYVRQLEGSLSPSAFWYAVEREPVADDPIHWRERHVEGLAPLRTLRRFPAWLGVVLIAAASTASSLLILWIALPATGTVADVFRAAARFDMVRLQEMLPGAETGFLIQSIVIMILATLTVGVRCSGAVTSEREKQTWDSLLTSPLPARELIGGKLWGVAGASYWYLLAAASPAVILSVLAGLLAFFWTLLWLGVTVLAMYCVGAAGLYCSVRAKSSWRSLLATLALAYGGGAVVFLATSILSVVPAGVLYLFLNLLDAMLGTQLSRFAVRGMTTFVTLCFIAGCGLLAFFFWLFSRRLLRWAAIWVTERERTRHWPDPPVYRRSRRRQALPRTK